MPLSEFIRASTGTLTHLAIRRFRRSPGFAFTVVLTLALGTGATAAVFSVIHAVLLRPLPWRSPETVGLIWSVQPSGMRTWLSFPELEDLQRETTSLSAVAGFTDLRPVLVADGVGHELQALAVSHGFFNLLGVAPAIGRDFAREDDRPSASPVAILSDGFWRNQFGSDPAIVGRQLKLNDRVYTVIGVLPPGFAVLPPSSVLPERVDVWLPLEPHLASRDRTIRFLHAVGRLHENASFARADTELRAYASRVQSQYGAAYPGGSWSFTIVSFKDDVLANARTPLYLLFGLVSLVLVMACANVANLLLARGEGRHSELAIRMALGAGPSRLAAELLAEALVLATCGSVLGVALSAAVPIVLRSIDPGALPRLDEAHVDATVLAFALALIVFTTVLFASVPLIERLRPGHVDVLGAGRSGGRTRRAARLGRSLVLVQTAFATTIVITTLFLTDTFVHLQRVDLGFEPGSLLTGRVTLSSKYPPGRAAAKFFDDAVEAARHVPGVIGAAAITQLPLSGAMLGSTFLADPDTDARRIDADMRGITPSYFEVVGTPLSSGRFFAEHDSATSPAVAIVDEAFAHRLSADGAVVGTRIRWIRQPTVDLEIVGIVRSVRHRGPAEIARETVYRPHHQYPRSSMFLAVQTSRDPASAAPAIRAALASLDPTQPLSDVSTMNQRAARSVSRARTSLMLAGTLAAIALILGLVGLYGVLSFGVTQRLREFGVRMALGATPAAVRRLVLQEGLILTATGAVLGSLGASLIVGIVPTLFYRSRAAGIEPYAFGLCIVLVSSALALWLPAHRASTTDPLSVLRSE